MSFAMYRSPGGVIFLDDDPDYLEMLAEVMPLDWSVRLFLRPVACIELLLKEPPLWEADAWAQQEIVNRWREGAMLIPQILAYWRENGTTRFELTKVCVVDYSMPAMSGLRVLSELAGWSGARVLLTGRTDEQLAVSAFNRHLIEQFVPKQSPELRVRLTDTITNLLHLPNARREQIWRATLTREQHDMLCRPDIAQSLEQLSRQHGWIEYVVIGAPFGVLALDQKANVNWVQLEPAENLKELAEMAESQGWDVQTVEDIRVGKKLIDLELQLALGGTDKPQPMQAIALGTAPVLLYGAIFQVNQIFCPDPQASHERFLSSRAERKLQD